MVFSRVPKFLQLRVLSTPLPTFLSKVASSAVDRLQFLQIVTLHLQRSEALTNVLQ